MLNRTVSPAHPDVHVIEQAAQPANNILVGAYCRVSTDLEVQKTSLDVQMMAYERIINNHPGWVLAGIYADKGLSGTSVNRRTEFLRMIADAKAGKLNYIMVKSVSRFARNTVDLLRYVRELKQIGVNVYFEKERIDTGTGSSEFLLSLFGAAAQEEIISLSNNMKVGRRMRYAQGQVQWTHIYGYAPGWKIVPEEAEVIRRIFTLYLSGKSLPAICDTLNGDGIPVATGKGLWESHTVACMLWNEKYAGHCLMQKTYIKDPIKHERVSNRGTVVRQYFMRNHHDPIVPDEIWEAAKLVLTMKGRMRGATQYPFYGILHCPYCGANMVRFHHCKGDFFWTCGGNKPGTVRETRSDCPPFAIHESDLLGALKNAGLPLEYWALKQEVTSISFPQGDWNHLLATPVDAPDSPRLLPISYDSPSNSPLPAITQAPYEWHLIRGNETQMTTFINEVPISQNTAHQMLKRISLIQDKVRHLSILPPESYEADVPRVGKRENVKKGAASE